MNASHTLNGDIDYGSLLKEAGGALLAYQKNQQQIDLAKANLKLSQQRAELAARQTAQLIRAREIENQRLLNNRVRTQQTQPGIVPSNFNQYLPFIVAGGLVIVYLLANK